MVFANKIKIKFRSAYARITLNKFTTAFFVFSFIHCFAQGIIQSFLFSVDSEYGTLISEIVHQADIPAYNMTFLEGHSGKFLLQMCNDIPHGQTPYPCTTIFESAPPTQGIGPPPETIVLSESRSDLLHIDSSRNATGGIVGVELSFSDGNTIAVLSKMCTGILIYPEQLLNNARREDLAFLFLQFWLFSISFIAILYDSIPHTLAVLISRTLVTGWSAYAIWRTHHVEIVFDQLFINPNTPCHINLFPEYFQMRSAYEISDLTLNCTALVISSYLSWILLKTYNEQSFKCLGPPQHIIRIYRFFMAVLVCLQLAVFLLVVALSLWADQLVNPAIAKISSYTAIYDTTVIAITALLVPWIAMGWYAIRHEMKRLMAAFLGVAFIFIACWSIMFYSRLYRWTLKEWPFLLTITIEAFIVIIASMVLGVICWLNFDKGLAQYLYADSALAQSDFAPSVFQHNPKKNAFDLDPEKDPRPELHSTHYIPTLHSDDQFHRQLGSSQNIYNIDRRSSDEPYNIPHNQPF